MGLSGGPNGAKAVFRQRFGRAFGPMDTLKEMREVSGLPRAAALAVLDGNVMMNGLPTSVDTFGGYVQVLSGQIRAAHEAAAHVVVVFDEPAAMTEAKRDEQARRDAQRKPKEVLCSDDLVAGIVDDRFTTEMLHAEGFNAKTLWGHRPARARFCDAVCVALLRGFVARNAHRAGSLTFDGVDARGAERPFDEPRAAQVLSTNQEFWGPLLAREAPIGEGDLKLTDVTQRVHDAAQTPGTLVAGVVLNLVVTIDTDSFAIELLQQGRRLRRGDGHNGGNERTIVCFKERAQKRKGDDFEPKGHYLCCDVHVLHEELVRYFYGTLDLSREIEAQQPAALALFAAALACCGCDFVEVKGMRSDVVFDSVGTVLKTVPSAVENAKHAWSGRRELVHRLHDPIRALAMECASRLLEVPRIKKDFVPTLRNLDDVLVRRTAWLICYWNSCEFKGSMEEFGFVRHSFG